MANVEYRTVSNTNTTVYVDGVFVGFIEKSWRNHGRASGVKPHYEHEVRATINGQRVEFKSDSLRKVKAKIIAVTQAA